MIVILLEIDKRLLNCDYRGWWGNEWVKWEGKLFWKFLERELKDLVIV